ncbi:hypothetical protein HU200_061039 [Digitaria exilis]|uniref:Uncharacterized protein n=1 Tax=Digitaria exilis TaxID=1010633 RepID=A0A835DYE4_9POAL|nr:hypothetical protein HU200_061039 [Digitaria exilis]
MSVSGGRAFLRLAASIIIVGHYHERSVRPVTFVPSSSSPPPPPIDGGRFSLDFIPKPLIATTNLEVADCHGGLTRRGYAFALLDGGGGGDGGGISISNFRVLHRLHNDSNNRVVGVFSTADGGHWRFPRRSADCAGYIAGRVDGSIYLASTISGTVKVLDGASLESREVDIPTRIDTSKFTYRSVFTVVHGAGPGPTSPASTWIVHVRGEALEFFRHVRRGGGDGESSSSWVLEHTIAKLSEAAGELIGGYQEMKRVVWIGVSVIAVGDGAAVLSVKGCRGERKWLFSVAMDTKKLQVVPKEAYRRTMETFTYALPWPQFLRPCPTAS